MKTQHSLACLILSLTVLVLLGSCSTSPDRAVSDSQRDSINAVVSRGDYLVNAICNCMHCHADGDYSKFSGPIVHGTEGKGGREIVNGLYVRNITPYALESCSDEELFKVLTTGIRKNGDTLSPIMPYNIYGRMQHEEVYAIIAYLRTLKPIAFDVPQRHVDSTRRARWKVLYNALYLKEVDDKLPVPPPNDKVKRGEYLVTIADCKGCHSKFDMNQMGYDPESYLSGGVLFGARRGFAVNTANLTPDTLTGLGGWSEEVFLAKFKSFRDSSTYSYSPGKYNSVMPWTFFAKLRDEDLSAIYAYLRTVKPISNKVEKWPQGE